MLWFALGLMLGGFLGMLLTGIFVSKRRFGHNDETDDLDKETFRKEYRRMNNNSGVNNNSNPLG